MKCDRKDCENIMCETVVKALGNLYYCCNECKEEFTNLPNVQEAQPRRTIETEFDMFMRYSPKLSGDANQNLTGRDFVNEFSS